MSFRILLIELKSVFVPLHTLLAFSRLISESEDNSNNVINSSEPTTNGAAEGSVSPAPQQPSQTPEVPVETLETIELMQEQY